MERSEEVRFDKTGASVMGALCGVALAIGVPWVLLSHPWALQQATLTTMIWVSICFGGLIALVSAFFGLVMPTQVGGHREPSHT